MSNSTAPKATATPIGDLPSHVSSLYHQTFDWLIANWFEALIAVAYLESGLEGARRVVAVLALW